MNREKINKTRLENQGDQIDSMLDFPLSPDFRTRLTLTIFTICAGLKQNES